ncbi:hypothetical protein JCM14036_03390 [Desulfotomaculum defluvii]
MRIPILKWDSRIDVLSLIEKNPSITAERVAKHAGITVEKVYSDIEWLLENNRFKVSPEKIQARRK